MLFHIVQIAVLFRSTCASSSHVASNFHKLFLVDDSETASKVLVWLLAVA